MTPSTLLSPLLTYCADLPGFSRDAVEVAETEQRIGTALSALHHWERSAVEWRESAERFRSDAALESAKRIVAEEKLIVQTELLADANVRLNAMRIDRDRYKEWCVKVMEQSIRAYDDNNQRLIVRPKPLEKE